MSFPLSPLHVLADEELTTNHHNIINNDRANSVWDENMHTSFKLQQNSTSQTKEILITQFQTLLKRQNH